MPLSNNVFSAIGKTILVGEHAVVDGFPAICMPLFDFSLSVHITDKKKQNVSDEFFQHICKSFQDYFHKEKVQVPNFSVQSSIARNSGFGSSAAFSFAVVQMLAQCNSIFPTKEDMFQIVQCCEKYMHGSPSGIDAATIVLQKPIYFQNTRGHARWTEIPELVKKIPQFFILDSGKAIESTKEMIEIAQDHPQKRKIFQNISNIVQSVLEQLKKGRCETLLFQQNEYLLEQLGVVGDKARHIIRNIESCGGIAKVCGAGGVAEGSGTIIAFHTDEGVLEKCVQKYSIPVLGRHFHES